MRFVPCALALCCAALAPAVEVNLQAGAAAVTEGGAVTITATRSDGVGTLAVPVALTGTPPTGISLSSGSFSFAAGALTATVQLQTTGDSTVNGARQATAQITVGGGVTSTNPAVTIGVRDDDVQVALSALDVGAGESPADGGSLAVVVSGQPRSTSLVVQFEVHGTARFESSEPLLNDFSLSVQVGGDPATTISPANGIDVVDVTIPAGEDTVTISVTPIADGRIEGGETCEIRLPTSSLAYVVAGADRAAVTIADDDNRIASFAGTPAFESGPDGTVTITFLDDFGSRVVQVPYSLGGAAVNGSDYATLSGVATLAAGASSLSIPIDAIYDEAVEGEALVFTLLPSPDYTLPGTPSLSLPIVDVAGTATIAAPVSEAIEGDAGAPLLFPVTVVRFAGFATGSLSVPFRITGGTAGSGEFSVGGSGVAWNAGTGSGVLTLDGTDTSGDIVITPVDDSSADGDKTVRVVVESGQSVTVGGSASATGTILDDEPVISLVREAGDTITEGGAGRIFTVSYPGAPAGQALAVAVTIPFTVSGTAGTADRVLSGAGLSLNPDGQGGSITIPAGSRSADIEIAASTDATAEVNETVVLQLSAPSSAYRLGTATRAEVVVVDSAAVPTVSITAVADAIEGRSIRCFRITRSGAVTAALLVKLADPAGSASSADYQALPDEVSIPIGATATTLAVTAIADGPDAGDVITLAIASDTAYTIDTGAASADATIVDGFADASIAIATEVVDPVLAVDEGWASTCRLALPAGLTAGRTRGSLVALTGGPSLPGWISIDRTSPADATNEAEYAMTASPPDGTDTGAVLFSIKLEIDIDGDGTFESTRLQDVLLWVLASGGPG